MSCPIEQLIRTESNGTEIYEYEDAATGIKKQFRVPVNHVYRCLGGEWQVFKVPGPPPKEIKENQD